MHAQGGPEVLVWEEVELAKPGAGEALLKHHAVGLNYIDVYQRSGTYPVPCPATLGLEAAGVVEALGEGVSHLKVGDRVAYAGGPLGAYSERRVIPADRLVKLPDTLSFEQGAAMMLQGMTAQYLLKRTYPVKAGDTILVHAAAGGVGLILCQWAKALGVHVIGTVGSDEKAALAKAHGCTHPIVYTRENFQERVMEITQGQKVPVVYDSIGRDTFMQSLESLAPLGTMVLYGAASGPVPPFDLGLLAKMGSLFITRPTLFTYTAQREDLERISSDLFDVVTSGQVKLFINQHYPLSEAAQAHRDLEARKTTGSTVFTL
jgi:NADPH2:quinone reductase